MSISTTLQPADLRKDGTIYVFTLARGTTVVEMVGSHSISTRKSIVFGELSQESDESLVVWDCGVTTLFKKSAITAIRLATDEECE